MKIYINIRLLICAFPFIFLSQAKAQSTDEFKYIMVITYLKTNTQANERIKSIFLKRKIIQSKDKFVDFNLSGRIDFMSIADFRDSMRTRNFGITTDLLDNIKLYKEKYYFKSFNSPFLEKVVQENNSKLFLTFTKPVQNYLIAEIGNFDPKFYPEIKFGYGLKMLFLFDSTGLLIEHVIYSGSVYN